MLGHSTSLMYFIPVDTRQKIFFARFAFWAEAKVWNFPELDSHIMINNPQWESNLGKLLEDDQSG